MNFHRLPKFRINGDLPKFWEAEALPEDVVVKNFTEKEIFILLVPEFLHAVKGLLFETWKTADKESYGATASLLAETDGCNRLRGKMRN